MNNLEFITFFSMKHKQKHYERDMRVLHFGKKFSCKLKRWIMILLWSLIIFNFCKNYMGLITFYFGNEQFEIDYFSFLWNIPGWLNFIFFDGGSGLQSNYTSYKKPLITFVWLELHCKPSTQLFSTISTSTSLRWY